MYLYPCVALNAVVLHPSAIWLQESGLDTYPDFESLRHVQEGHDYEDFSVLQLVVFGGMPPGQRDFQETVIDLLNDKFSESDWQFLKLPYPHDRESALMASPNEKYRLVLETAFRGIDDQAQQDQWMQDDGMGGGGPMSMYTLGVPKSIL